jgi:hypothetical protein
MRYIPTIMFLALIAGFIHGRFSPHQEVVLVHQDWQTDLTKQDPNFEPIQNPLEDRADDRPVVVESNIEKPTDYKLFEKGEEITCIYQGIFSWSDGNEFVKAVPIECKVVELMEGTEDMSQYNQSKYYQRFKVDCTKDVDYKSGPPGAGLVKGHKLNVKQFWTHTENCYHFVTPK